MRETKIPFGERDGVLYRAFEVENGLACNCVCPGCQKPLNAANQGEKVAPYFRHAQAEDCVRGYKDGVRRAAIALIANGLRLTLPSFTRQVTATTLSGRSLFRDVLFPAASITADAADRFVDMGDVIAHAVLHSSGRQLLVRIKISPRMEYERYQRIEELAHSSIEIDLSGLSFEQVTDPAVFSQAVLSDPETRTWIRSLRGELMVDRAQKDLASEVEEYNVKWKEEQVRQQAIAEARRVDLERQAAGHSSSLEAHRVSQRAAAEAQKVLGLGAEDDRGARQRREDLIVGQTLRAAREWGGHAVECSACCLLNPPGTQFCLYCTSEASTMSRLTVPPDVAATIQFRMRSSAKPDRSIRVAPTLLVLPDLFPTD